MAVFKKGPKDMWLQEEKESEFDVASGNFDEGPMASSTTSSTVDATA